MPLSTPPLPTAVVLSCAGAPDGDLNVVRALGRRGVPVYVVSEYADPPASRSRYCEKHIHLPGFTRHPENTIAALIGLSSDLGGKPVLFPTADPDLQMVSAWRDRLDPYYDIPIARPELVRSLTNKREFAALAAAYDLPVPVTHTLDGVADLGVFASGLNFPVIIKPADTLAWSRPDVEKLVGARKALIAWTRDEFLAACLPLMPYAKDLLVQGYIPGRDEYYFDFQAYIDRQGNALAWFSGRKIRTSPPAVGAGCYVESSIVERLSEVGLEVLRTIGFTGLADLDFKFDPESRDYLLIEINPRTAAWNILPTACGINFPYIAYADLVGIPFDPVGKQAESRRYLHFGNDLRAFLEYRRRGEWSLLRYIRSLLGKPLVFQLLAFDDLGPFLRPAGASIARRISRLFGGLKSIRRKSGSSLDAVK